MHGCVRPEEVGYRYTGRHFVLDKVVAVLSVALVGPVGPVRHVGFVHRQVPLASAGMDNPDTVE